MALDSFRGYGEGVREGIARFGLTRPRWTYGGLTHADIRQKSLDELRRAAGFLGGFGSRSIRQRLRKVARPAVDVLRGDDDPVIPVVCSDDRLIGRLAFEHLSGCGLKRLICLDRGTWASRLRAAGFLHAAEKTDVSVDHFVTPRSETFAESLAGFRRPFGIFASDDQAAVTVVQAAHSLGLRLPEDVAVLGVNDSMLGCAYCDPPLSSVRPDWERIGYQAAMLLAELISGARPPTEPVEIPPLGVTIRQSTDVLAIDDADVVAAVRWIRGHADQPGNIEDLMRDVPVSRRTLERKFRVHFGRSPFKELRHHQVEHIKRLLIHTDWPMPRIAGMTAFRDAKDMATQFRKYAGTSPTAFRRDYRAR